MNRMLKKTVAAFAVILLLSGCGSNTSSQPPAAASDSQSQSQATDADKLFERAAKADKLVVGTTMAIENASRADYYFDVLSGTLSQLAPVWMDEKGGYQPLLTDFTTEDAQTWTLTVRDGMRWHDGVEVTAADIAFTLEYLDREEPGQYLGKYEKVEAADAKTLRLTLKAPNINAPSDWTTLRILPQHIYKDIPTSAEATVEQAVVGCGPYRFQSYDKAAGTLEFTANRDYPGMVQKIENVTFRLFGNADTLLLALRKGEVDLVYSYAGGIDPVTAESLSDDERIALTTVQDLSNPAVLVFNNAQQPWDNLQLRQAVAYALDYDTFGSLFGSPHFSVANSGFVPAGSPGYIDTAKNSYDLDKANAALDAAGADQKDAQGIRLYNGAPLTLSLTIRNDKPVYQRMGELMRQNLAQVGVQVELALIDVPQFRTITEQEHSHQAMISRFTAYGMGMNGGMGSAYLDGRLTANGQGQIADPAYHAIADRLRGARTQEEYLAAAADCQRFYAEKLPAVALYWDSYLQAYDQNLSGFVVDGTFGLLNVQTWGELGWDA